MGLKRRKPVENRLQAVRRGEGVTEWLKLPGTPAA